VSARATVTLPTLSTEVWAGAAEAIFVPLLRAQGVRTAHKAKRFDERCTGVRMLAPTWPTRNL
jgi:hypothetical protein